MIKLLHVMIKLLYIIKLRKSISRFFLNMGKLDQQGIDYKVEHKLVKSHFLKKFW